MDLAKHLKRGAFTPEALAAALKRGPAATADLAAQFGCTDREIASAIAALQDLGSAVHRFGEHWCLTKQPAPSATHVVYASRKDSTFVFGAIGDNHAGSKYERLDVLHDLYDWFAERGVDRVFHAGNWIEGEDAKTQHDVLVHGLEPQIDYLIATYPQRKGIHTYTVWGEDHEGWFARRESIDMGRFAERKMRDAGRDDWHDLGFMEAGITLKNAKSGVEANPLLVMHPGGGSSYAVSYRPQKIVESLQGGEKPSVILIGHYHKMSINLFRSIWCVQVGCSQDQTPFMRKKGLDAHVGGMILTLHQDPQTGAIHGCDVQQRQYFNQRYENHRWSKSGPVVHPAKTVIGPKRGRA